MSHANWTTKPAFVLCLNKQTNNDISTSASCLNKLTKKDTIEISLSIMTKEQKHIKEYHISFHHGIPILKQI